MKKLIIGVITAVILRFTITPVSSGSFYATLSGTAAASNDSLAMVDFSIRGDTVNNVRGYINYPASQLSVFSVEKNPELTDLAINFDTDKSGSVYFAARSSSPMPGKPYCLPLPLWYTVMMLPLMLPHLTFMPILP